MKLINEKGSTRLPHTTSETSTQTKYSRDAKASKFEPWREEILAILASRQAYSQESMSALSLARHQHSGCNFVVCPDKQAAFNEWAAKEDEALVGAFRIMLDRDGKLLLIAKVDLFKNGRTNTYHQGLAKYTLMHAAESDKVSDEDHGAGIGLTRDQAHPLYCLVHMRCCLLTLLQSHPSFFMYLLVSANHQHAIFDINSKNVEKG